MKTAISVLLGLLLLSTAQGATVTGKAGNAGKADAKSSSAKTSWEDVCAMYSKYGEEAEKANQNGVPLSTVISKIEHTTKSGSSRKLFESIVLDAYKEPRVTESDLQEQIVSDYGNQVYERCAQSIGPNGS